jgi:hypothetical protein
MEIDNSKTQIAEMVANQILKYWNMAPIKTVSLPTITSKICKLVDEHDARKKSKGHKDRGREKGHIYQENGEEEKLTLRLVWQKRKLKMTGSWPRKILKES